MLKFGLLLILNELILCLAGSNFYIDYDNNTYVKNGKPYRYISGAMHYFRVPQEYWRDRMLKMKVSGLTAIQTYIEWSSHQPQPDQFIFSDNLDIEKYFQTAADLGLDVILRPGPYIDAERDFGGLPFWLLKDPSINLRTSDPKFFEPVKKWYQKLFQLIEKYLHKNGGPIILIQVENEYGSYGTQTSNCDKKYLSDLRDLILQLVGDDVVLFTTDGNWDQVVQCGQIQNVYATVDFGSGTNVNQSFEVQRRFEPKGPLVNSEYYSGWIDHWQEAHSVVPADAVDKTLDEILSVGANVNIYMFHGGTSFGLKSGSNGPPFAPNPTSYDFNAPVSESGDLTQKYWTLRNRIGKYSVLPDIPSGFMNVSKKGDYGSLHMNYVGHVMDMRNIFKYYGVHKYPMSFEDLNQEAGLMLYETKVSGLFRDPAMLNLTGLADRAYIYVNSRFVGILSRAEDMFILPVQIHDGDDLAIIVENQGRLCYGPQMKDRKGLTQNITLGANILTDWRMSGLPFDAEFNTLLDERLDVYQMVRAGKYGRASLDARMTLWSSVIQLPHDRSLYDTFVKLPGWHKGILMINGKVVGRYWPVAGPQVTLYVPKSLLKPFPDYNKITIFEQDGIDCYPTCTIEFVTTPILNKPTPSLAHNYKSFN